MSKVIYYNLLKNEEIQVPVKENCLLSIRTNENYLAEYKIENYQIIQIKYFDPKMYLDIKSKPKKMSVLITTDRDTIFYVVCGKISDFVYW